MGMKLTQKIDFRIDITFFCVHPKEILLFLSRMTNIDDYFLYPNNMIHPSKGLTGVLSVHALFCDYDNISMSKVINKIQN